MILGIDDAQGGIAVLVLQRPDIAGERIELQTIDVTVDLIAVIDVTVAIIFDDRAGARQAGGIGAVGIGDPDVAVRQRDRVRRFVAGGRYRQGGDVIDF